MTQQPLGLLGFESQRKAVLKNEGLRFEITGRTVDVSAEPFRHYPSRMQVPHAVRHRWGYIEEGNGGLRAVLASGVAGANWDCAPWRMLVPPRLSHLRMLGSPAKCLDL
jgi:hypothetical protein